MELLNLLLYTTAFSQLSYSKFFDFCLINIFLKYAYYYKPSGNIPNNDDITTFAITFAHLTLHVLSYYCNLFIYKCEQNKYGKHIIYNYNLLNKSYLQLRCNLLYYGFLTPFKYVLKKIVLHQIPEQNVENFKKIMTINFSNIKQENQFSNNNELKTNKQIDLFLDKILVKNKNNKHD